MLTITSRRIRARAAAAAAAVLVTLPALAADPAGAAPQTFPDPGGSGASVTLSTTQVYPGQRLQISGSGFFGGTRSNPGDPVPPGGVPLIAIKPYDIDTDWTWGGASAYAGPDDAKIWFAPDHVTGDWSGYIDIPSTLTPAGILPGATDGKNWLRVLSGAFSTGGSGPLTGNTSVPITYQVPFTVIDRVTLGLTAPTGAFQSGSTFRQGAQVTPRGVDFTPSTAVDVTLDGTLLTLPTPITTTADGAFPVGARVPLPAGTSPGAHTLTFTTGAVSHSRTITVVAPPTATLLTPSVRPGGRLAFKLTGYLGVGNTGQRVAVVVNEAVLACLTASGTGELTGTAVLPATIAEGPAVIGFNAGTSCVIGGPVNDLPGTRVAPSATVAATAPTATAADGVIGKQSAVSGAGFPAGATLTATLDGAALEGSLTVGADGSFSGDLPVPAATAAGEHLLLLSGGGATAAATLKAVAPAPEPQPQPQPQPQPGPAPTTPKPASPAPSKLKLKGSKLTITLAAKPVKGTKVVVQTAKKVKLTTKGKAKTVVVAKVTTKKDGTITVTLTADGKKALKRFKTLKVVVEITAPNSAPTTKTLTLKG